MSPDLRGRRQRLIQSVPSGKYKQTGGTNPSFCREQIHKFLASGYFSGNWTRPIWAVHALQENVSYFALIWMITTYIRMFHIYINFFFKSMYFCVCTFVQKHVDFQILLLYGYYMDIWQGFCLSDHYFYAWPLKAEKLPKHFAFLHSLPNYAAPASGHW